jgi:2-methylisocitrate lyase-like PEP mutase family enzyme/2-polyprenyl-6-methoxyphenol hydroxylase-like FAD-dependent oxidoreductase
MSTMTISATRSSHSTVIIAGMGPAGMVAALALAQQGVQITVLEAGATLAEESRASTFHPSSLEILDALGVGEELHARGLVASNFQYRDRSGAILADLDLSVLADDTAFAYRLQSEQNNLTEIILSRLETMPNVTLVFGAPVNRAELGTNTARVFLADDGREPSFTADWLIAADGAKSNIRKGLGIAFEGMTIPERFLVASTTHELADDIENLAHVSYVSDPHDWGVLLRTPRHWRVLMPVAADESDEAATDPDVVEQRLQKISPKEGVYPLEHITIYAVQQRVASTMSAGRVLLVGDSAHVNNPLGGMGMNSGIHDARAAADVVLAALSGADAALCAAAYDHARRDAANSHVQKSSKENYREMSESDAAARHRRTESLAALTADPERLRSYLLKASMLTSISISNQRLRAGLRAARSSSVVPAGRRLAALLAEGPVIAPGAHDSVAARLLVEAGLTAGFISGAGVSATDLGVPDLGYVGQREMAEQIWRITGSAAVPFIADGDGGYGGPLQVARTVRSYERAGAAAITLEDQRLPKRMGQLGGKELISIADMTAKLRAAVDARGEMLVIARTDALGLEGFDAARERAIAYAQAGADLMYVEGVLDADQLIELHRATGLRLVVNRSEAAPATTPAHDMRALVSAGVGLVLYPVSGLLAAAQAVQSTYESIARTNASDPSLLLSWPAFTDALDLPALTRDDESYVITA